LRVLTEYLSPKKLKPGEKKELVGFTRGQWSDGIGEGEFKHAKETGMTVDLSSSPLHLVSIEQIDDGIVPPKLSPLFKIVKDGNIEKLKAKLAKKADVNVRDKSGTPLLNIACLWGNCEIVLMLVEAGADVRADDEKKSTALKRLAMSNNPEAVSERGIAAAKALVESGASIDARDDREAAPLMWAANRDKSEMVKYFVSAGAEVNAQDSEGNTALMWCQRVATAEVLLQLGANPAVRNARGEDAAGHAERNKHWRESAALMTLFRGAVGK
jgi:ankyrin repeat protein